MTRLRAGLVLGGIVVAAGVAVAVIGTLFVDRVDEEIDATNGDEELAAALVRAEHDAREEPVDLTTVVDGDWERVVIACPGDEGAQVDANLGFEWSGYAPPADGGTVNVYFADDDHVLRWAELTNQALCQGPEVIAREDAVLERVVVDGEHGSVVFAD